MATTKRLTPDRIFPTEGFRLNNTTVRDWQQSDLGGGMTNDDMVSVAPMIDQYYANISPNNFPGAAEVGGGTVPRMDIIEASKGGRDQSPFDHIRELKKLMPHTPFMALIRSDAGAGMEEIPPDILSAYLHHYHAAGIDVFRNFHALNDPRAFDRVAAAVHDTGGHLQAAYSWAVYDKDPTVYNPKSVVTFYKKLVERGVKPNSFVLKDPSGVLTPEMARLITREVKKAQKLHVLPNIPFGIHTHNQAGWAHEMYKAAIAEGANFVDAAPTPGGYGAQPPIIPLFNELGGESGKKLGFANTAKKENALNNLKQIDVACEAMLSATHEGTEKLRYPSEIRQNAPDPGVCKHGVAGGQSSGLKKQLIEYKMLDKFPQLLEMIPQVREEAGAACQVTPVADYIARETSRRLNRNASPDENFYCGFTRLLTGEMGPTKEPMNEKKIKTALKNRAESKLEQFLSKEDADRLKPAIPALVEHMWKLAEPVRIKARMHELVERISELEDIRTGHDQEEIAYMNKAIQAAGMKRENEPVTDLQDAISKLNADLMSLQVQLADSLQPIIADFKKKGIGISGFKGKSDSEKYEAMYEAMQRPEFKATALLTDISNDRDMPNRPLFKLFKDIFHQHKELFAGVSPDLAVKLIRSAGLTTVCWGEIIPPALDKVKQHLKKLHAEGQYHYPVSKTLQAEDEILIGMLNDPRVQKAKQFDIPNGFLRRRDNLPDLQIPGAKPVPHKTSPGSGFVYAGFASEIKAADIDHTLRERLMDAGCDRSLCNIKITECGGNNFRIDFSRRNRSSFDADHIITTALQDLGGTLLRKLPKGLDPSVSTAGMAI